MDGGWCKICHKHFYNAMSGIAIIIRAETRKILYIGVTNKYCAARARSIPPDSVTGTGMSHLPRWKLILSWRGSLRQNEFVDSDSSVHSTLLVSVPGWGRAITKLDCANHA